MPLANQKNLNELAFGLEDKRRFAHQTTHTPLIKCDLSAQNLFLTLVSRTLGVQTQLGTLRDPGPREQVLGAFPWLWSV